MRQGGAGRGSEIRGFKVNKHIWASITPINKTAEFSVYRHAKFCFLNVIFLIIIYSSRFREQLSIKVKADDQWSPLPYTSSLFVFDTPLLFFVLLSQYIFIFGHSPNITGYAGVRLRLTCQPCNCYLLPGNGLLHKPSSGRKGDRIGVPQSE